jgi:hypothetical protein
MKGSLGLVLAVAFALRLAAVLASDRVVADVKRYERVATHVLDVSWNPYAAPRLYPYPPVWMWFEAASEWLARRTGASFAVLVKLPVLAADLGLVAVLGAMGRERGLGLAPAWTYALHPVALLIGGFHGQFDALALLALVFSIQAFEGGRFDRAALALAAAIAVKSFPVLLLPFFLLALPGTAARLRFLVLSTLPVGLSLLPFAIADSGALRRELFGYGGVADFGWIGLVRGVGFLTRGVLERSEAVHWPNLVPVGKSLFLAVLAAIVVFASRRRALPSLDRTALLVFLAFLTFYGAISAQYLLWVVPFAALSFGRWATAHAVASTIALIGFYALLAPGVLTPAAEPAEWAGPVWVAGVAGVLAVGGWWWRTTLAALAPARDARAA